MWFCMNYRDYKTLAAGGVYHFFNRGVNKEDIFTCPEDYILFLRRFKEQVLSQPLPVARRNSYRRKILPPGLFEIYAYCLMPNHFHFLIKQVTEVPVSDLFRRVMTGYSKVFNAKHDRVGALFQDQYKAVAIETDAQLQWVSAYIHQNPLAAGLTDDLDKWAWSSYLEYAGKRSGTLVNSRLILGLPTVANSKSRYTQFVLRASELTREYKDIKHLLLDGDV